VQLEAGINLMRPLSVSQAVESFNSCQFVEIRGQQSVKTATISTNFTNKDHLHGSAEKI